MEEDEEIIHIVATDDYKGHDFAFENGKVAKIELSSYATKTNRKKLAKHIVVYLKLFICSIFRG